MRVLTISSNHFLDNYILNAQFAKIANISLNAYRYWKDMTAVRYEGSRTIFLHKNQILQKHKSALLKCENLDGLVLSSAFCSFTGLSSSHLIKSNGSNLYELLHVKMIDGIKFVNLKQFYDDLNLSYEYNLYIEKCHFFSPEPLEKKIQLTKTMCVGYY